MNTRKSPLPEALVIDPSPEARQKRLTALFGETNAAINFCLETYGLAGGVRNLLETGILPAKWQTDGDVVFILGGEIIRKVGASNALLLVAASGRPIDLGPLEGDPLVMAEAAYDVVRAQEAGQLPALVGWTEAQRDYRLRDGLWIVLTEAHLIRTVELKRRQIQG